MSRVRRALLPAASVAVGALVLSGCSFGQIAIRAGSVREASLAQISISPAPTGVAVAPSLPVVVSVAAGRLTGVVVTGPTGAVPGSLSVDGRSWTSSGGALDYNASYSVRASAVDRSGLPTDLTSTIQTVAPSKFVGLTFSPRKGAVVGVGLPVSLTLDRSLKSDAAKAALERQLRVTADGAAVEGAWSWSTDSRVVYRPKTYWPGNADIKIVAALKGVKLTTSVWGEKDRTHTFSTGPATISYVDMQTHKLTFTQDGKKLRTIPITTGKAGFDTRSGIKVIMSKERTRLMDAATGGTDPEDPEYYRLEVEYAMRVTNSGEFLHAAPWSVGSQGRANVSHGCTGMSTSNALWLYTNSRIGDVVVYTGNNRMMEPGNGIGLWNVSWKSWKKGSALL